MNSRKTLKSVSVEELKPTIALTPVIEPYGEGCRIHHIKSDSIARDGRDTFVPLRYVSKQKRRIFELEDENEKLRELLQEAVDGIATKDIRDWRFGKRLAFLRKASELGIEVDA